MKRRKFNLKRVLLRLGSLFIIGLLATGITVEEAEKVAASESGQIETLSIEQPAAPGGRRCADCLCRWLEWFQRSD